MSTSSDTLSDTASDTLMFETGFATAERAPSLVQIIKKIIEESCAGVESPPSPSTMSFKSSSSPCDSKSPEPINDLMSLMDPGDFVQEAGDYLVRVALKNANLAERLLTDPYIGRLVIDLHERSYKKTDMADLSGIVALDLQLTRLRKIRDLAAQFAKDVQEVWRPTAVILVKPTSPLPSAVTTPSPRALSQTVSVKSEELSPPLARKVLPSSAKSGPVTTPPGKTPEADDSADDDEGFQAIDMNALRHRGVGKYNCPKGKKCDKGGVDKDGNPIDFKRNSAFIQHCNKHRRPWKCNLEGCPNPPKKRRFARRDGLERHMRLVEHLGATNKSSNGQSNEQSNGPSIGPSSGPSSGPSNGRNGETLELGFGGKESEEGEAGGEAATTSIPGDVLVAEKGGARRRDT